MNTKNLGTKIADARKRLNLSQAQLAEQITISPQAVGKWERGESLPDIFIFNRLAEIFGVDLNYFSEKFDSTNSIGILTTNGVIESDENPDNSSKKERQILNKFDGSNLIKSDFANIVAHKSRFNGSELQETDFSMADMKGSVFKASNASGANFNKSNLTDCTFFAINLSDSSFNESLLVRTEFSSSEMKGAKFSNLKFMDVKFSSQELKDVKFENCIFDGTEFKNCNLKEQCFDGQTFINVKFDKVDLSNVSFKGAILENISFNSPFSITNKYYKTIASICFEGAKLDKLTYANLKGLGANLSNVILIVK